MKWASKVSLAVMGLGLAVASRPVSANPVLRLGGPEAGLNPDTLIMARNDTAASFLAVLADPANAGMNDPATVASQLARINSLKALSLSGLGAVSEIAACNLDGVNTDLLAPGEAVAG